MKVAGIVGWHDSGKTTLLIAVVQELVARGHTVSTIKHAHHGFDVDRPGKDSWQHREAGASEVLVGSAKRWALMHELRGTTEPGLDELLAQMSPVDIVLVEGFKSAGHDKIEVYRAGLEERPLVHNISGIVAFASDNSIDDIDPTVTKLDSANTPGVADFIEHHWALTRPARSA